MLQCVETVHDLFLRFYSTTMTVVFISLSIESFHHQCVGLMICNIIQLKNVMRVFIEFYSNTTFCKNAKVSTFREHDRFFHFSVDCRSLGIKKCSNAYFLTACHFNQC